MSTVVDKDPYTFTVTGPCGCCGGCADCCPPTPNWVVALNGTVGTGTADSGCSSITGFVSTLAWDHDFIDGSDCPGRMWGYSIEHGGGTYGFVTCLGHSEEGEGVARLFCTLGSYVLQIETSDLVNGLANYTIPVEDWNCDGCNELLWAGPFGLDDCCDFTGTSVTVCPEGMMAHAPTASRPKLSQSPSPAPCKFLPEEPLTIDEKKALGLSPLHRRWSLCLHPDLPLGEYVCSCLKPVGCGPNCSGYVAKGEEDESD